MPRAPAEHLSIVRPLDDIADKLGDAHGVKLESNGRAHVEKPTTIDLQDVFAFYWHFSQGEVLAELQYRPSDRNYRNEEHYFGSLTLFPNHQSINGSNIWMARGNILDHFGRERDKFNECCLDEQLLGLKLSDGEKAATGRLVSLIPGGGGAILTEQIGGYFAYEQIRRDTISPIVLQAAYLVLRAQMVMAQACEKEMMPIKEKASAIMRGYLLQKRVLERPETYLS